MKDLKWGDPAAIDDLIIQMNDASLKATMALTKMTEYLAPTDKDALWREAYEAGYQEGWEDALGVD